MRIRPIQNCTILSVALLLGACDAATQPKENVTAAPAELNVTADPAELVEAQPPAAPNYDQREGDIYMYVAAVSEEDRKKGISAGAVVLFRYLGVRNGIYRLQNVTDGGAIVDVSECASPCKVIKSTRPNGTVEHIGFNPASVIGSAFDDAFAGRLMDMKKSAGAFKDANDGSGPSETSIRAIPAAFTGEWNAQVKDCGTDANDSRLRIEPGRLGFYGSEGNVTVITVQSSQSVSVQASFSGEGQTWKRTVQMALSRSGDDLTIEGYVRHRCPA